MKSVCLFYPLVIISFFITIGELGNARVYGSADVEPD